MPRDCLPMIDERTQELIHAAVDGELDAAGQERLRAVLDASEEARHYHAELARLAGFLDDLPQRDLPPGLHAEIVQSVRLPERSRIARIFSLGELPAPLRYGFAAAAGLVLAVALYEGRDDWRAPGDMSNMVGTISRDGPSTAGEVIDRFVFENDSASAEVDLSRRDGALILDLRVRSQEALEFRVDLAASGLRIGGVANPSPQLELLTGDGRREFRGSGQGEHQMVVILREDEGGASAGDRRIDVRFLAGNEDLGAGSLAVPGPDSG